MNPPDPRLPVALEAPLRFSRWLDSGLRLPGTGLRFGLDSLIGLIPVVGDAAGLLLSLWLLVAAHRAGAPSPLLWRMAGNVALDTVGGALPLLGDAFDFLFKANARNAELLRQHFGPAAGIAPPPRRRWPWALLSLTLTLAAGWWFYAR